jgi:hypothetical protein
LRLWLWRSRIYITKYSHDNNKNNNDQIIKTISGKSALRGLSTIAQKVNYIQHKLGFYLVDHSKVISVNNNENWKRMLAYNIIWVAL